MKNLVISVIEYFTHASTWQGLVVALTGLGVHIAPQYTDAIVTAGGAVFALLKIFAEGYYKDNTAAVAAIVSPPKP